MGTVYSKSFSDSSILSENMGEKADELVLFRFTLICGR